MGRGFSAAVAVDAPRALDAIVAAAAAAADAELAADAVAADADVAAAALDTVRSSIATIALGSPGWIVSVPAVPTDAQEAADEVSRMGRHRMDLGPQIRQTCRP
jgi:hypothetical protein